MSGEAPYELLLAVLRARGASGLYLRGGRAWLRFGEHLHAMEGPGSPLGVEEWVARRLDAPGRARLVDQGDVTVVFQSVEHGRFRLHAQRAEGGVLAIVRALPDVAPSLSEVVFVDPRVTEPAPGLSVIAGPARSGRTATRAAVLQTLAGRGGLLALEDLTEIPLRAGTHPLWQGAEPRPEPLPQVFAPAEPLEGDGVRPLLEAAEAGRCVVVVVTAMGLAGVRRALLDGCPEERRAETRGRLADLLVWVRLQKLLPRLDGPGHVVAGGMTVFDPALREAFRTAGDDDLDLERGTPPPGLAASLNRSLAELVQAGRVALRAALAASSRPDDLLESVDRGRRG